MNLYSDNILFLKFEHEKKQNDDIQVNDYEVPLALVNLQFFRKVVANYDTNINQIIEQIDGIKSVKQISFDSKIDIQKVKQYLIIMIKYQLVKMIDIFSFQNRYTPTEGVFELFQNENLKTFMFKYIIKQDFKESYDLKQDLSTLYVLMSKEIPVTQFLIENQLRLQKIYLMKFIQFGLIHNIIRRVHLYPIQLRNEVHQFISSENYNTYFGKLDVINSNRNSIIFDDFQQDKFNQEINQKNRDLNQKIKESQCVDSICVCLRINYDQLEQIVKPFEIYFIYK